MFKRLNIPPKLAVTWAQQNSILPEAQIFAVAPVGNSIWYLVFKSSTVPDTPPPPEELLRHPTYLQLSR